MTKHHLYRAVILCGVTLVFAGCNKQDDSKGNYQAAINDYYKAHPACLWQETKKFPVQAATSDDAKTEGYDALTDGGLLARTTAEKKVFIIASKQIRTNRDTATFVTAIVPSIRLIASPPASTAPAPRQPR
jgi:hypothetical protein